MNDRELKHFGILGMHWGVRKSQKAKNGANTIRKVGGSYADAFKKQQSKIQSRAAAGIARSKYEEQRVRRATESYASKMDAKSERLKSQETTGQKPKGNIVTRYARAYAGGLKRSIRHPINSMISSFQEAFSPDTNLFKIFRHVNGLISTKELTSINKRTDAMYAAKGVKKIKKFVQRMDVDIKSFDQVVKTGIKTKDGKPVFTPKEVVQMQAALRAKRDQAVAKMSRKYGVN